MKATEYHARISLAGTAGGEPRMLREFKQNTPTQVGAFCAVEELESTLETRDRTNSWVICD
jgi:hypothetical protein